MWKTDEGEGGGRKHYFVNFCYLALLYLSVEERLWVGAEKYYLGPTETSSFSSQDLVRPNKHDWLWLVVLIGYFYISFLWGIVVSDLPPLEIQNVFSGKLYYMHTVLHHLKKNQIFPGIKGRYINSREIAIADTNSNCWSFYNFYSFKPSPAVPVKTQVFGN